MAEMNLEMTWQRVWKERRCFAYFFAAARKHHNQGNLQEKGFVWITHPEG